MEIDVIGQERAVPQPTPAASAEFAVDGGQFHLQPTIVVPRALNPCALNHAVLAEQPAGIAPLPANAVQKAIGITFLGSEASVLVPEPGNTVPFTVSERHFFAELTVSIPGLLNRGSHVM